MQKKIEIIPCILMDHNLIKLYTNDKESFKKHQTDGELTTHSSTVSRGLKK
jgi:hypothetical protein